MQSYKSHKVFSFLKVCPSEIMLLYKGDDLFPKTICPSGSLRIAVVEFAGIREAGESLVEE